MWYNILYVSTFKGNKMKRLILIAMICIFTTSAFASEYFGPTLLTTPLTVTSTTWVNVVSEPFTVRVSAPCTAGALCQLLPCQTPNMEQIHAKLNFPNMDKLNYRFLVNGKVPSCGTPNKVTSELVDGNLVVSTNDTKGTGIYTVTLQVAKKLASTPNVTVDPSLGHKVSLGTLVVNN